MKFVRLLFVCLAVYGCKNMGSEYPEEFPEVMRKACAIAAVVCPEPVEREVK